jgi:hypothetical protein
MKPRVAGIIGGIIGGVFAAFACGIVFAIVVVVPIGESYLPEATATPEPKIGPRVSVTVPQPSAAATIDLTVSTPPPATPTTTQTATVVTSTPSASATPTTAVKVTTAPSPTPTPRFPFYYKEGSRIEDLQCAHPYLQGWVRDAAGTPLNGVVIRWDYWGNTEYAISGDPEKYWQAGEWKLTYGYGQKGFDPNVATDFVLQVVTSADTPDPLSAPLVIHYTACHEMGQITNIIFKRR